MKDTTKRIARFFSNLIIGIFYASNAMDKPQLQYARPLSEFKHLLMKELHHFNEVETTIVMHNAYNEQDQLLSAYRRDFNTPDPLPYDSFDRQTFDFFIYRLKELDSISGSISTLIKMQLNLMTHLKNENHPPLDIPSLKTLAARALTENQLISAKFPVELEKFVVNVVLENGYTHLMSAIKKGSAHCVKILLEKGADPNFLSDPDFKSQGDLNAHSFADIDDYVQACRETPLLIATKTKNLIIAQLLVDKRAHLENHFAHNSLLLAAQNDASDILELLLISPGMFKNCNDSNDAFKSYWDSAFSKAAKKGNCKSVKLLCLNDPSYPKTYEGRTRHARALSDHLYEAALTAGCPRCVEIILYHGADPEPHHHYKNPANDQQRRCIDLIDQALEKKYPDRQITFYSFY